MIGTQLTGRYDILSRIGGGGMALVYKAHDNILNRKVAIKVLRQQFVNDEDFIRRFRREAQSAASLSHPNVVSIYDVGQDGETHFIVMELVEGNNLNERIKQSAPLQVEEAVKIAAQICDALSHAHQNEIIHRDIKPHNILLGKNGRVKVTDFGIARAAASSDITQTGSVIGSVHYFSPEHAKGISQGAKSDLYSLGIVLYQMLTNKLPFLGESPISIALKHLQEHVEDPRKVNPAIPQSLENVILKALQKDPEDRYQSAEEMLEDLDTCLLPERLHEVKIGTKRQVDAEKTRILPAIGSRRAREAVSDDPYGRPREFSGLDDRAMSKEKKLNHWFWIKPTIWLVLLLLVLWGGYAGAQQVLDSLPKDVEVPTVIGMTVEEATSELEKANLKLDTPLLYEHHNTIEEGRVIDQSRQDMTVKEKSTIQLTVSNGPFTISLDDYVGESFDQVYLQLQRLGMDSEQIKHEYSNSNEPSGLIIEQSPEAETEINPSEDSITFVVSEGTGTFEMPNLIGFSEEAAKSILIRHDLKLAEEDGVRSEPSFTIAKGIVSKQFPFEPGDPVEADSSVVIFVSSGYPEEALEVTKDIEVRPAKEGESSDIRILYSDARGESREWGERTISETTVFPVNLVLSPDQDGIITYYVDGKYANSFQVTYEAELSASEEGSEEAGSDDAPSQQSVSDDGGTN